MAAKFAAKRALAFSAVLGALTCLYGQEADSRSRLLASSVEALTGRYHELGEFNGAVLVSLQRRVLVNRGYGLADFEAGIANGPATKFLIGSISKQFTAVMIMKLVEAGQLSLDATLAEALPYYRQDTGSRVTIRHLLGHTSGIPSFTDSPGDSIEPCPSTREFIIRYCSGDLLQSPGSLFRYNNGGYIILGAVVEQVTGLAFEEALLRNLFDPLGMKSSGLGRRESAAPLAAKGYQRRGGNVVAARPADPFLAFSAGGLYSTTTDLALWEGAFSGDAILSPRSRQLLAAAPANAYFGGQRFARRPIGPDRAERDVVFHGGRIVGFNSLLLRVPEDRVFIVLLNNTDSTRLETMAAGILDILYGRSPRPPRRSLAEACRTALGAKSMAAAIEELRAVARQEAPLTDPEPEEMQLNALGYELFGQGRRSDAAAVFAFAAAEFPNSWNAHDSLAEAQAALGNVDEAVKHYEKSLALNPDNANAREQILKLKKGAQPRKEAEPCGKPSR